MNGSVQTRASFNYEADHDDGKTSFYSYESF